jgi:hypothetical protein
MNQNQYFLPFVFCISQNPREKDIKNNKKTNPIHGKI